MIGSAPEARDAGAAGSGDSDELESLSPRATLFGRRRGKRMTARRDELMRVALPMVAVDASRPIDPAALFQNRASAVWLEIGFGGGEHLATCALAHPEEGYIGCEAFRNGVAKALTLIEAANLRNVRLYHGDARAIVEALPERSLDGIYLLYPDPWPKRRHRKRRFLSDVMLTRLARIMSPGAQLRFATDIDDNAGWTLVRVLRSSYFSWTPESAAAWQNPWEGWQETRFEVKALRAARRPVYFTFRRNSAVFERAAPDRKAAASIPNI
jgi:tRNA (guanine-N7-)-methyltransferase